MGLLGQKNAQNCIKGSIKEPVKGIHQNERKWKGYCSFWIFLNSNFIIQGVKKFVHFTLSDPEVWILGIFGPFHVNVDPNIEYGGNY